jgi:hypothetical protein
MGADSYPSTIKDGDEKRHFDVFARLRVITDWSGFADQQRDRRQSLRKWLDKNTKLTDDQASKAQPVKFCDLPQGGSWDSEKAFIAEREVWWLLDDLGDDMQKMKSANRDWLEAKRQQIWNNAEGNTDQPKGWDRDNRKQRYDNLAVATKHGSAWANWKKTHNTSTGKPKDDGKSWRDRSMKWHEDHVGITEQPAGSNCDNRSDGIRASQDKCAGGGTWLRYQPWCGVWCYRGLLAGNVKGIDSHLASVAQIEDYAKKGQKCYRGWTTDRSKVGKGDLAVIGGYGVHVETVRGFDGSNALTYGGNTSSGSSGSQDNGGGAFKRSRSPGEVRGYALIAGPST